MKWKERVRCSVYCMICKIIYSSKDRSRVYFTCVEVVNDEKKWSALSYLAILTILLFSFNVRTFRFALFCFVLSIVVVLLSLDVPNTIESLQCSDVATIQSNSTKFISFIWLIWSDLMWFVLWFIVVFGLQDRLKIATFIFRLLTKKNSVAFKWERKQSCVQMRKKTELRSNEKENRVGCT